MPNLDDNRAKNCILSIRLAPDGFSFFVLDETRQEIVTFFQRHCLVHQDAVALAIRELNHQQLERLPFRVVNVLLDYPEVTTVPFALYDEDKQEELFCFNYDLSPREFVVNNSCSQYGVETIFPIPKNAYEYFAAHFCNYRFVHRLSLLLHQANSKSNIAQEQLFIAYNQDHFTAVGLRNHRLIYHNVFNLNSDEDLIYYLLLVFQELQFDQYAAVVHLDGALSSNHSAVNVIKEYVQHVSFSMPRYVWANEGEDCVEEGHYYTALFEVHQCEL